MGVRILEYCIWGPRTGVLPGNDGTTMVITVERVPGRSLTRPYSGVSHWGRLKVAELKVGPGRRWGLAQQQDREKQQQQQPQEWSGDQRVPGDPGGGQYRV